MTPRGAPMTQARVRALATGPGAIILCGRFEGFDERIFDARPIEQLSMGDIILSGGEMAALLLLDACIRLLPGVMGAASSGDDESFRSEDQTSELQSLMRISYAVFCLKKKK